MKRFSDGNMGGPNKRFRGGPNDVEVRLLIPSKVAGSIIGRGGKNISRLRTDYKATVTVPDCPGPERILTVLASDLETALKVVEEIVPNLDDNSGNNRGGKGGEDVDLRMLVHQSQAGCIIGKGGSKVKELREKTGARIKIYTNCCPDSTDRVVQITGRGNTCINCIKEVNDLLKTAPVKGVDNPYDPHNFDDMYAHEYGGYGYGLNGGGMGGGRGIMGGGPPMVSPPRIGMRGDGPMMDRPFGGPPRGMGGPRGFGGNRDGGFGGNGIGSLDGPMMGGGRMGGGMGSRNGGPESDSTQVTIPKDLAGAIIGKAGARIRKIRVDSGAGITIDEPLPGSNDRIITITGSPNQIQMAQYLLQQSVHENTGMKGGPGGRY